jgi:hypothetical protein
MASILVVLFVLAVINLIMKKDDMGPFMNPVRMMIPVLFSYGMLIIWFIWVGIGSIRARRWARALSLVFSWLWLIGGIIGTIVLFLVVYNIFAVSPNAAETYKMVIYIMKTVTVVMALVFFILVPGIFILIYSRRNIKLTCEFWDRQVRWTDKCPLAVLILVVLFVFVTISLLGMLSYARVAPAFGTLITGFPAVIILLIVSAAFGYSAWGMYHMDMKVWWIALMLVIVTSVSTALTFYRMGLKGVYFAMIYPKGIEFIREHMSFKSLLGAVLGSFGIPIVGYLFFVRKYFVRQKQ